MSKYLYRWLDDTGDGGGTNNAIGDYSDIGLGVEEFFARPPTGEVWDIHRMIVSVGDTTGFTAAEYGNRGALTNGITVFLVLGTGVEQDLCDGVPIKTNAGWGATCYDADLKSWGPGDELLLVRWTFTKAGQPLQLGSSAGVRTPGKLGVRLNDDFSGLTDHRFMIQGKVS